MIFVVGSFFVDVMDDVIVDVMVVSSKARASVIQQTFSRYQNPAVLSVELLRNTKVHGSVGRPRSRDWIRR